MNITIKKFTDEFYIHDILKFITGRKSIKMTLGQLYDCEHSPIYTQLFLIYLESIPSYVSVHLTRHEKNGCQHFVGSNRSDNTGIPDEEINRMTPVNHVILCNAKHIIDISRKRLCKKADKRTNEIWNEVCKKISNIDYALYERLMPDCQYRGGYCHELSPCFKKN